MQQVAACAAITFDGDERLTNNSAPVTAPPFTMAVRVKRSGGTGNAHSAFGLCANAGTFSNSFTLAHSQSGDGFGLARARTTSTAQAVGPVLSDISTGNWTTLAGVFGSSTSRFCYANGDVGSENTTSLSPAGIDVVECGANTSGMIGDLCDWAIWDKTLTADDIAKYHSGMLPVGIECDSLVFWFEARTHTDQPRIGESLSTSGTVETADHPQTIYPAWFIVR